METEKKNKKLDVFKINPAPPVTSIFIESIFILFVQQP